MVAVNWSGYPNGQIPASKMVAVEGFLFEPVTAACVRAFMTAARAAGHTISITQGYRELGKSTDPWNTEPVTQWSAWNAMKQGKPLPGAATVASAAPPGTSTHGDGMSADYTGTGWHPETGLSEWAAEYAINYGIVFDIPTESWHGHRKLPPKISLASSDNPVSIDTITEGDSVARLIRATTGGAATVQYEGALALITDSAGATTYTAPELSIAMAEAKIWNPGGALLNVTREEYLVLVTAANARKR